MNVGYVTIDIGYNWAKLILQGFQTSVVYVGVLYAYIYINNWESSALSIIRNFGTPSMTYDNKKPQIGDEWHFTMKVSSAKTW